MYLRLRKVLEPLTFVSKDNNLFFRIVKLCYLNFYFFFIFEVDKSGALAPTYPPSKRKSDLRSSFLRVNQAIHFTWKVIIFRRWTVKMMHLLGKENWDNKLSNPFLVIFCGRAWLGELILLWLLLITIRDIGNVWWWIIWLCRYIMVSGIFCYSMR